MPKAILTVDDAPTKITPRIIDYLRSKGIVPVVNFIGAEVEGHLGEAVYAAKNGALIGNHSFTHPNFSQITLGDCRAEIERTEREIDRVYRLAGVTRKHRFFRFPYGDRGGAQAQQLQQMLRDEFQFERLDDSELRFPWWKENHLDTNTDMSWSFDFEEYQLPWNNGLTWEHIMKHIHNENPEQGGYLLAKDAMNIILIHDMEQTDRFTEGYFERLIDTVLALGVEFVPPRFVRPVYKA